MLTYLILAFHSVRLPEKPTDLTSILNYTKTPFPLTRGYLKMNDVKIESQDESLAERGKIRGRKPYRKKAHLKVQKKFKRNRDKTVSKDNPCTERKYLCSICKKKQYKYRRNKLRHEKYECITGPQFACEKCGKKYSQKKTLTMHIAQKHEAMGYES